MKEKIEQLLSDLQEDSKLTKLDVVLGILVALFSGVLLGILISPRRDKTQYFGCGNGNNYADDKDECEGCECDNCGECDCEGGLCCKEDCSEERCCGEHEFCGNDELCCKDAFEMDDTLLDEEKIKIEEDAAEEVKSYVQIR